MVFEPWLSVAEIYVFMVYVFLMWFALYRLASGAERVRAWNLTRLLTPAGLMLVAALAFAWVGPVVRLTYAGNEMETGWGFIVNDFARLGAAIAVVVVFAWYARTRGKGVFVGRVPSWTVLLAGALLAAGLLVLMAYESSLIDYGAVPPAQPGLGFPILPFVLLVAGAASVLGALAVRLMRARSAGAVLTSTQP